jgi:hypothetical protein
LNQELDVPTKQPCPYKSLPATSYWRRSVADVRPGNLDPIVATKFAIDKADRVATAGSCFAQHIARYLARANFNYYVVEQGHSLLPDSTRREFNYGTFSARYGNVYTTRQLLQLLQRATGAFAPEEPDWQEDGHWVDPFRPSIQPGGFASPAEVQADRRKHLECVLHMMKTMNVFVFTLGLTETWRSCSDGAVFPICPGCGAGSFDPQQYEFINLTVDEVVADLRSAIDLLRRFNPKLKVLLTVSPVPLIATNTRSHVLPATTYSKSVLRVAAEMVSQGDPLIDYFPSYEIITGAYCRGAYFAEDLREVREDGVSHVMKTFFRHYVGQELDVGPAPAAAWSVATADARATAALAAKVVCDEEQLDAAQ